MLQKYLCFVQLRKQLFFFPECRWMHQPPAAAQLYRMPQVQHFVIDEILDRIERHAGAVKNAAHDDGIVRGVVMSQTAQRVAAAPCHLRARHQAMKEAQVQVVKNLVKVVILSLWALNAFAPAHLADQMCLGCHGLAAGKFAITRCMGRIDRLAMKLGDQNMQDGVKHGFWRAFQKIGKADKDPSLAKPYGVIDVGKTIEADLKFRYGRTWTQITICLLKNLGERIHLDSEVAAANVRK